MAGATELIQFPQSLPDGFALTGREFHGTERRKGSQAFFEVAQRVIGGEGEHSSGIGSWASMRP